LFILFINYARFIDPSSFQIKYSRCGIADYAITDTFAH
jgi:hypothetical protein